MSALNIDATSGTGADPSLIEFPDSEHAHALVCVYFCKEAIPEDYASELLSTGAGYLNDPDRALDCVGTRKYLNLPKSETGTPLIQVSIHSGARLSEDDAAQE